MVFNRDELYMIMSFVGYGPEYRYLNADSKSILEIIKKEHIQLMDIKYPMWSKISNLEIDQKSSRVIMFGHQGFKLERKYSIPIYYLNLAALANDWASFWIIIEHHGLEIIPAALLICHCFRRFDISKELIRRYGFEALVPLVEINSTVDKYTWMGGVYQYPILYQMHELGYEYAGKYAVKWIPCFDSGWMHGLLGFLHPKMQKDISFAPIDEYWGDLRTYPEILASDPNGLSSIRKVHRTRYFLEFPCVNQVAIDNVRKIISLDNFNIYTGSVHPIWPLHIMDFLLEKTDDKANINQRKRWPSALRMTFRLHNKESVDLSILNSVN